MLASKATAVAALSLLFALLALAAVAAVGVLWLSLSGAGLHPGSDLVKRAAQDLLVTVLGGLLGLAIGAVVHGQIAGIVGTLVWVLLGETLVAALLTVVGLEGLPPYLPFRALNAAQGGTAGELSYWAGVAVSVGYIAVLGAAGLVRTLERDIA